MDLAYVRAHPDQLPTLLRHQRIRETPVTGGEICAAARLTLDDGSSLFVKTWPDGSPVPPGMMAAEAAGLRWLAQAGAVAIPEVLVARDDLLALEWVEPAPPEAATAERFGRELAALHRTGAPAFGAPWPGYIGRLRHDNTEVPGPWPRWFAEQRIVPHLRTSADRGALCAADVALVERVVARVEEYGGDDPPARIHGDLWSGNLLWTPERVWLVDPAAHGGHRESDLAALTLFGGPPPPTPRPPPRPAPTDPLQPARSIVDRIVAAYQEVWPLAGGWQARVPLHQLYILVVHTAHFGASWRDAVVAAARAALAAR